MLQFESNITELINNFPKNIVIPKSVLDDITHRISAGVLNNMMTGRDYMGNALAPKKKGGQLLYQTGTLFSSIMTKITEFEGTVYLAPQAFYAYYVNYGLMHGGKIRQFWGIDTEAKQYANEVLQKTPVEQFIQK